MYFVSFLPSLPESHDRKGSSASVAGRSCAADDVPGGRRLAPLLPSRNKGKKKKRKSEVYCEVTICEREACESSDSYRIAFGYVSKRAEEGEHAHATPRGTSFFFFFKVLQEPGARPQLQARTGLFVVARGGTDIE